MGQVPGRGMIDFYPLEAEAAIQRVLKLDWNTLIPGDPGVGGRYGPKAGAQDPLTFLQNASAAEYRCNGNIVIGSAVTFGPE